MRIFLVFVLLANFACPDSSKYEIVQETVRECDPYLDCKPIIPINFEQKSTQFVSQMNVNVLVSDLAKDNRIDSMTLVCSGTRSAVFQKFKLLKLIANQESLELLLNHEAANVRYYAFQSLISLDSSRQEQFFKHVRGKYDFVESLEGCVRGESPLFLLLKHQIEEYEMEY